MVHPARRASVRHPPGRADPDWKAADRLEGPFAAGSAGPTWYAGLLIGPGALALEPGDYLMRARIADAPETVKPFPARPLRVAPPP